MAIPLGMHSPKIDIVRALQTSKGRREQGRFAIEGPTLLAEALRSGAVPEAVYATQAGFDEAARLGLAWEAPAFLVPEKAMARMSELETPPGLLAVLPRRLQSAQTLLAEGGPVVLLAGVADPGNAGTLVRSAEIFGFRAVIFGSEGVEPHNPKVVRASMGAVFRLALGTAKPEELFQAARANGYSVVATGQGGVPLPAFTFPERLILAIGNERHGTGAWLVSRDVEVSIPQVGEGESLNAAVAGSIIFYAFSQRERNVPGVT